MALRVGREIITIEAPDIREVERALGGLKDKAPRVLKYAANATARDVRREMIRHAEQRYELKPAGKRRLRQLKQRTKATDANAVAVLGVKSLAGDLGYFKNIPNRVFTGTDVANAPEVVKARVLRGGSTYEMTAVGNKSKGFLLEFESGHIGMVQRNKSKRSGNTETRRGNPRWEPRHVLVTRTAPSETAMHTKVWPEVEDYAQARLRERVDMRTAQILAQAARKK